MGVKAVKADGYFCVKDTDLADVLLHITEMAESYPQVLNGQKLYLVVDSEMQAYKPRKNIKLINLLTSIMSISDKLGLEIIIICADPDLLIPEIKRHIQKVELI